MTSLDIQHLQISHRWPAFLDGRRFLYTAQGTGDSTGIYLGSLDSPNSTRLAGAYSNTAFVDGRLLFVSEGALVAQSLDLAGGRLVGDTVEVRRIGRVYPRVGVCGLFSALQRRADTAGGGGSVAKRKLRWFDRQGKQLGQLGETSVITDYSYGERLSPDGRTVAISTFRSATADIWMVDIARDVASRFTFDDANELYPVWSPDGSEVLFSSNRGGFYNIYRKRRWPGPGRRRCASSPRRISIRPIRTLTAATVTTTPDFSAGRPTKLFDTIVDTNVGSIHAIHYTPTADGQRFLLNVSAVSETPVTVVLNWAPWTKP